MPDGTMTGHVNGVLYSKWDDALKVLEIMSERAKDPKKNIAQLFYQMVEYEVR